MLNEISWREDDKYNKYHLYVGLINSNKQWLPGNTDKVGKWGDIGKRV